VSQDKAVGSLKQSAGKTVCRPHNKDTPAARTL
jgi:hypothetical protein